MGKEKEKDIDPELLVAFMEFLLFDSVARGIL
jgi:hypothetical protein